MNELDAIVRMLEKQTESVRDAVLTTVVHVKGSAYRRPGARMLILRDGRREGSISGGCLEGDVCKKAWWFTEGGKPSVRVYDTASDDDAVWEFGLGCKGSIHVLFERVDDPGTAEMMRFISKARRRRQTVIVATVVGLADPSFFDLADAVKCPVKLGDRLLFDAQGVCGGALAGSPLEFDALDQAREAFLRQKSHLAHVAGPPSTGVTCGFDLFVEAITPVPEVVVFGAGHDAQPLVRVAKELGWNVTVADGRANYATRERFPDAENVVVVDPREPMRSITIGRETLVVMMTHNYVQDAMLLKHILTLKPRYLGLLGPKSRTVDLLEEVGLPVNGIDIHAPVGFDLGSDSPASIALAIVGEMQAVLHGRTGGMLHGRERPIHDAVVESGAKGASIRWTTERAVCELG